MSDRFGNIEIQRPTSQPVQKVERRQAKKSTAPKPPVQPAKSKPPNVKRLWISVFSIIFLFAIYSCIGFFGVPYYLTQIIPNQFSGKTEIHLEVESVRFNPLNFKFESGPIRISDKAGLEVITVSSVLATLKPLSLLRHDLVADQISIQALDIHLTRELDSSYNLQKLFGDQAQQNSSEIMNFSELPFFFSLNNITLKESRLIFKDLPTGKTHRLEKIELDLPSFSNIPIKSDSYLRPHFSAVINGSPIELTGQENLSESGVKDEISKMTCAVHDIALPVYMSYLPFDLPVTFRKGLAQGNIDISFDPNAPEGKKLAFGFDLQVKGAELFTNSDTFVITAPALSVKGDLLPVSNTLRFKNVVFREPVIRSYGSSLWHNVNSLFVRKEGQGADAIAQKRDIDLDIDLLLIDNGAISLTTDINKKPKYSWLPLQLSVKNFSTKPAKKNSNNKSVFRLSGEQQNSDAYFSWQGSFHKAANLSGLIKIVKIDAGKLFSFLGLKQLQSIRGRADLRGTLDVSLGQNQDQQLLYNLDKAELTVENLKITDAKKTVLTAAKVTFDPLKINTTDVHLGNISIENGSASLQRGAIPEIFQNLTKKDNSPTISSLSFGGKVSIASSFKPIQKLIFTNFIAKADELDLKKGAKNNLTFSAKSVSGGIIGGNGSATLSPFSLTSKIDFEKLPLSNTLALVSNASFFSKTTGSITGKGQFTLGDLSFTGKIDCAEFYYEPEDQPYLSWEGATFSDINYTAHPSHLGIGEIEINKSDLIWNLTGTTGDPVESITTFFHSHFPAQKNIDKKSPNRIAISPLDIQNITIKNSNIRLSDERLDPDWQVDISDFTGNIADIHSAYSAKPSPFNFDAKIDGGLFTIKGELGLFNSQSVSEYELSTNNFPLASFQDQLLPRFDIKTNSGKFDLLLTSKRPDKASRNIETGHIVFSQLQPLSSSANSALPIALLSGTDNRLQLGYKLPPAQGSNISLFEHIAGLFETLIVKGSLSPLLLASGNFTDLIDEDIADFIPGEFMLSDKGRQTLTRYSALLISHPLVGLTLSGGMDTEQDRAALTKQLEQIEQKRVEEINNERFEKWQSLRDQYEKKLEKQKALLAKGLINTVIEIPTGVLNGFTPIQPEPVVVDTAMLYELAEKRLAIVNQFFTTQLALEPGKILISAPEDVEQQENVNNHGVKISLRPLAENQ